MTPPAAHVAGVPVEEAVLALLPLAAIWLGLVAAHVRARVDANQRERRRARP